MICEKPIPCVQATVSSLSCHGQPTQAPDHTRFWVPGPSQSQLNQHTCRSSPLRDPAFCRLSVLGGDWASPEVILHTQNRLHQLQARNAELRNSVSEDHHLRGHSEHLPRGSSPTAPPPGPGLLKPSAGARSLAPPAAEVTGLAASLTPGTASLSGLQHLLLPLCPLWPRLFLPGDYCFSPSSPTYVWRISTGPNLVSFLPGTCPRPGRTIPCAGDSMPSLFGATARCKPRA